MRLSELKTLHVSKLLDMATELVIQNANRMRKQQVSTVSRVVLTPGFLVGPEFDYVPVGLGYRAVFRAGRVVRPLVGAGVEYQHRDVNYAPAARQLAVYLEGGSMFAVAPHWMVGAAVGMDVTVAGGLGFGLLGRVIATWSFGSQRYRRAILRALMAKAPKAAGANGPSDVTDVIVRLESVLAAVGRGVVARARREATAWGPSRASPATAARGCTWRIWAATRCLGG